MMSTCLVSIKNCYHSYMIVVSLFMLLQLTSKNLVALMLTQAVLQRRLWSTLEHSYSTQLLQWTCSGKIS